MRAFAVVLQVFVLLTTTLFWITKVFNDPDALRALWPLALSMLLALAIRDWRVPITWTDVRGPQPRQAGWRTVTGVLILAAGHLGFSVLWSHTQHIQTPLHYSLATTGLLLLVWGITLERADRRNRHFGDQPYVAGAVQDRAPSGDRERRSGLQDA